MAAELRKAALSTCTLPDHIFSLVALRCRPRRKSMRFSERLSMCRGSTCLLGRRPCAFLRLDVLDVARYRQRGCRVLLDESEKAVRLTTQLKSISGQVS